MWLLMLPPVSVKGGELRSLVCLLGFSVCVISGISKRRPRLLLCVPKGLCWPPFPSLALNPSFSSFFLSSTMGRKAKQDCCFPPQIWDCMGHPGSCDIFIKHAGLTASRR